MRDVVVTQYMTIAQPNDGCLGPYLLERPRGALLLPLLSNRLHRPLHPAQSLLGVLEQPGQRGGRVEGRRRDEGSLVRDGQVDQRLDGQWCEKEMGGDGGVGGRRNTSHSTHPTFHSPVSRR